MSDLRLRRASEADASAIRDVIAATFPDNVKANIDVLTWQYWRSPFGPTVSWVWDDEGRIAAHYTSIPYPALLDGRLGTVGVGVDAAIHPDYQGQKLFTPLARALYDDTGRHGMPGTICYPNENSVRGITRAGWQPIGHLRTHLLVLDPRWIGSRTRLPAPAAALIARGVFRRRSTGRVRAEELGMLPGGLDNLWAEVGAAVRYGVIRDERWFRWRYVDRPISGAYRYYGAFDAGRLCGAAVTTERDHDDGRFTYLLELLATSPTAGSALVGAVADSAATTAVILATLPGSATSVLARASGLRLVPGRLEPKPLHFGIVDNAGDRPDLARGPWTLGWGDLDHI